VVTHLRHPPGIAQRQYLLKYFSRDHGCQL
jgi:hypothetical protein